MLYSMHLHHTIILGTVRTLYIWISFLTLYCRRFTPPYCGICNLKKNNQLREERGGFLRILRRWTLLTPTKSCSHPCRR